MPRPTGAPAVSVRANLTTPDVPATTVVSSPWAASICPPVNDLAECVAFHGFGGDACRLGFLGRQDDFVRMFFVVVFPGGFFRSVCMFLFVVMVMAGAQHTYG